MDITSISMVVAVIEWASQIGSRLARIFGESETGFLSVSDRDRDVASSIFDIDSLSKILPFEAYDEEHGIFLQENSLGFVIEASPVVGAEESTVKEIRGLFEELLEEGASIQCCLLADHKVGNFLSWWERSRGGQGEVFHEISKRRSKHYLETQGARMFRFILSYAIPIDRNNFEKEILSISEKKNAILRKLEMITYAFSWKAENLLNTVGNLINFDFSANPLSRKWNPYQSISSQLTSGGSLSVREDCLEWKNDSQSFFNSFRTIDFPDYWSLNAMQLLIGDGFRESYRIKDPFYIHFGVHCPKQSKTESAFWRKSQLIENQGRSGALLRLIPDLANELNECNQVRHDLKKGAKFVWTQLSAGLWSTNKSFLESSQVLKSIFRMHQFKVVENRSIHLPYFLSTLPMCFAEYVKELKELDVLRTTLTPECANFVPIEGEWMGTTSAGMLLVGRRGQILNWNPFDNRSGNYNVVVSGRSGSGKSVFMQDLLISGLSIGARVFVIDVGRSFEKMCDLINGQKIEFSGDAPICLNPFTNVPLEDNSEREASFNFLKSVIGCMAAPTSIVSDYQNALIEKAIHSVWENKKNEATITDIADWLSKQEESVAKELSIVLIPFTKQGVYGKYFEGKNNVNFHNRMVLIELEELKEKKDLQAVVLQLFIMAINNHAFLGDRKTPFFICIDEAWDLLRSKQTGVFIETLARRLRKYYGSLVIGTQSIEDFFSTPGAQAAYQNSDWMCFLSQKKSSISLLAQGGKLDIDQSKIKALESVSTKHGEYSEVMIVDGSSNFSIGRLILDPFSRLMYSTRAQDHSRIATLMDQGLTVSQAIHSILEETENA